MILFEIVLGHRRYFFIIIMLLSSSLIFRWFSVKIEIDLLKKNGFKSLDSLPGFVTWTWALRSCQAS